MNPQVKAFLECYRYFKAWHEIIEQSDDGYNVLVGSLPGRVQLCLIATRTTHGNW